jgi:hypothetical protein
MCCSDRREGKEEITHCVSALSPGVLRPGSGQVPDEMGLLTGSGVHLADAQVDHALGRVQNSLVELTLTTNLPALRCECQTGV